MDIYENYVPQPLTVYAENFDSDRGRWNRNQCQCKGQETFDGWRLILTKLDDSQLDTPPFHIKRDAGGAAISEMRLKSVDGTVDWELTGFAYTTNNLDDPATKEALVFLPDTYTDILQPPSDTPLVIDDKEFYLWITDGTTVWYTETFFTEKRTEGSDFPCAPTNCDYIRLGYVNQDCIVKDENGMGIVHNNTASFTVLLAANIARPEYEFEPEGQNDGQGATTKNFFRADKTMGFTVSVPEYMADALSLCQVVQTVVVEFKNGDSITCRDVSVTVEWGLPEPVTNCYASVTMKFRAASWIRSGCC